MLSRQLDKSAPNGPLTTKGSFKLEVKLELGTGQQNDAYL